ncbi:reversion-inducing cysteine-rich protein with Kazal motifs [Aplysia californica]|uniref:Reversion-inducing cysteine-rich protein with Kazal motifs n=1 Tax=Aplysia californica TaxID=6500 RepID=A0ABM0ZW07_APLCA|nr:reversion-inducing cysteine-rich protein with Kazal motifs [Aplysia californica]
MASRGTQLLFHTRFLTVSLVPSFPPRVRSDPATRRATSQSFYTREVDALWNSSLLCRGCDLSRTGQIKQFDCNHGRKHTDMYRTSNMIILLLGLSTLCSLVSAKAPACCASISSETCRKSCHQVHGQSSPIPQMQMLLTAAETCPPEMTDFWQCISSTLPVVEMMSSWSGKPCCDLARGKECRRRCNAAESEDEMLRSCSIQTEPSLFTCTQNQEDAGHCCRKATSTSCGIVCRGISLTGVSNTKATRAMLSRHCGATDKRVEQCVLRQWQPYSGHNQNFMPCCEHAETSRCRSTCRSVLRTVMSENDRIDELIQACSAPQPTDPLWQCFLTNPSVRKNETAPVSRIDNAKLQCCSKATSSRCRELCTQTFRTGWWYHSEFESICSYMQPVSTVEPNMHSCLTDVDQPCKLGCSGLKFCSNFNHRPTELFRSCSPEADSAARRTYMTWLNGEISLPHITIPVKDISQCVPEMWKAIACALEIKPCSSELSLFSLCKEDCLFILTKCGDASKLSGDKTVPALCNALPSKSTPGACVSMESYLFESPHSHQLGEVHHPCNPSPCAEDEVCLLKRRKCKSSHQCLPYVCHKACPLGQVSQVLVPKGTAVRLANPDSQPSSQEECHLACQCSSRGKIENCKSLTCLRRDSCLLGHENRKEHGDHFLVDGNPCVCQSGKLLCARRSCQPDARSPLYTGMPGNCPTDYHPVCGTNGKTYPNTCIAKCAGVTYNTCDNGDICSHKPCPSGFRCVPRPQVCLNDLTGRICPQFQCVDDTDQCNPHHHEPACSTRGEEFTNLCLLFSHGQTLAYRGHCQTSCSNIGVVCGHDGQTYGSECAAHAARVTVDYASKCQAFGNLTGMSGEAMKTPSCNRIQCPPLSPSNCNGIVPPGGCCAICTTQLTLLWDPRLMNAVAEHQRSRTVSAMDVLNALSNQVSVQECDVFGYISVNGELVVIVAPVVPAATMVQVEACETEAGRLYNLMKLGSPNLASYLVLSPLLPAAMERSSIPPPVTLDPNPLSSEEGHGGDPNSSPRLLLTPFVCALVCFLSVMVQRVLWKL